MCKGVVLCATSPWYFDSKTDISNSLLKRPRSHAVHPPLLQFLRGGSKEDFCLGEGARWSAMLRAVSGTEAKYCRHLPKAQPNRMWMECRSLQDSTPLSFVRFSMLDDWFANSS